jgi:hypothetical protein
MVKGSAAIGAMWKSMAEQVSDPKVTTLDVKPLRSSAAREIGIFSHRQVCRGVGESRRGPEARGRYLERRQVGRASGAVAHDRV